MKDVWISKGPSFHRKGGFFFWTRSFISAPSWRVKGGGGKGIGGESMYMNFYVFFVFFVF